MSLSFLWSSAQLVLEMRPDCVPLLPTALQAPTPQDHCLLQQSTVGHPVLAFHCLCGEKTKSILSSVQWEVSALSHMCTQSRASPRLCAGSFPVNISVVSLSHEVFSLWDGETAWELETTLLGCTCRALQNHPRKSLALPLSAGIGEPCSTLPGAGGDAPQRRCRAGQSRAERVSRSSRSSSFG